MEELPTDWIKKRPEMVRLTRNTYHGTKEEKKGK